MDQAKVYFQLLKKHHFWVLSGLIVLAGFVGWYFATGSLAKEFAKNKQTVEQKFRIVKAVEDEDPHPNEQWKEELAKQTSLLSASVFKTWQALYSVQKQKVLKWPKIDNDFAGTMQSLPPDKEIPTRMRDLYRYDVKRRFPELVLSIGALPPEVQKARERAGAGEAAKRDYIVKWDVGNQEDIIKSFSWGDLPSSQQVRFAQEDLWAYTALLNIIKTVNEGATGNHNAKLKKIDRIAIGSKAAEAFNKEAASNAVAGSAAAAPQAPAPDASAQTAALADNRYVDEKGKPLAATAEKPKQFNRMPVFMRLTIDQREVGKFLVECANSPLPIEVRQFRLETPEYRVSKAVRGDGGGGKALDLTPASDEGYYDVSIEVFGIIYIFNPPDPSMINNSQVAASGAATQ